MTILWHIHAYPPEHGCGAESMAHSINKRLIKNNTVVVAYRNPKYEGYEGVMIVNSKRELREYYKSADIIFTHLDKSNEALNLAREMGKPLVWFAHNTFDYPAIRTRLRNVYPVYNAEWAKEELDFKHEKTFTLRPPFEFDKWANGIDHFKNEYITLVNHNRKKGGLIAIEIAREMPDKKFLFVEGGYDAQCKENLPNITYARNTPNIKEVYDKTRIIIMPSEYESWGLVATEAMCSGIPVIYQPTPGLSENCKNAGIKADRDNIGTWIDAIKSLDNEDLYKSLVSEGINRAKELDPEKSLNDFEFWLNEIIREQNSKPRDRYATVK